MEWDGRVEQAAKAIFSFCRARTASFQDAEDLAQDVLLELTRSLSNLRDEQAFYGFMWSVARNVYRQWLRKKRLCPEDVSELPEMAAPSEEDDGSDVQLLRRELGLLREKYRRVTVAYYMRGLSCAAIAAEQAISESMVKYLLFKARIKLKEGMSMERNLGRRSYDPRRLSLRYWSNGGSRNYPREEEIISQNILFACYNDRLTAEEISLEIGVGLPYMEKDLEELVEYELLLRDGRRYTTNLVLFTENLARDIAMKSADAGERIAALVRETVVQQEANIRAIGFTGADMPDNSYAWQMTALLLFRGVIDKLSDRSRLAFPVNKLGQRYFVWGVEQTDGMSAYDDFSFGTSGMDNARGDRVRFMDFAINGEMAHPYFWRRRDACMLFLDIAAGKAQGMSDIDEIRAAEMIRLGYLRRDENGLKVNVPVYTRGQFDALTGLLDPAAEAIAAEGRRMMETTTDVLRDHIPAHLRNQAPAMAYFRLFEEAISVPIALLFREKFLLPAGKDGMLPTAYVVVSE